MDASLALVLRLIVQNVALFTDGTIGGAPQDAVRMRIFGRNIIGHVTVVPLKRKRIVIPVNGHRQGVSDEEPK